MAGTATVGDRVVDCAAVTMPVLSVSAAKGSDRAAGRRRCDPVDRSHAEVMRLAGGHVGIVAGRTARRCGSEPSSFLAERNVE